MKLGTRKKYYQMIYREQEQLLYLFYDRIMLPYKFSCLLNNSETLGDIFAKLATNIKHRQCAEIKNHNSPSLFMDLCLFVIFSSKIVFAM